MAELFRICRDGCKSWYCDRCAFRMGRQLQDRTAAVVGQWSEVNMLTLTFDPSRFPDGPGAAWWHARGLVGRLVRDLRRMGELTSADYVWFWEPHKSGWPHIHVLVEARFVKHAAVKLLWDRYGCGTVVHCRKRDQRMTKEQAAFYASGYCTKGPDAGWPSWVMDSTERIVRFGHSKHFFTALLASTESGPVNQLNSETELSEKLEKEFPPEFDCGFEPPKYFGPRVVRSHAERIQKCGSEAVVQVVLRDEKPDGELIERVRYAGRFYGPPAALAELFGLDPNWPLAEIETADAPELWKVLERSAEFAPECTSRGVDRWGAPCEVEHWLSRLRAAGVPCGV